MNLFQIAIIATIGLFLQLGCSLHQDARKFMKENNAMTETVAYIIKDQTVDKDTFDNFLESLQEIPHTWFSTDMSFVGKDGKEAGGGQTGYNGKDNKGNIYEYRCQNSPDESFCSITIKTNEL